MNNVDLYMKSLLSPIGLENYIIFDSKVDSSSMQKLHQAIKMEREKQKIYERANQKCLPKPNK